MHHPGCWVKHGGCATQPPHESQAMALAYGGSTSHPAGEAPHPGEGTRVRVPQLEPLPPEHGMVEDEETSRAPVQLAPRALREQRGHESQGPEPAESPPAAPMISDEATARRPRAPYNPEPAPPATERGRTKVRRAPAGHHPQKPLPSVYRSHRLLRYWYIPAAAALALSVAFGIIWIGDRLAGGEGEKEAGPVAGNTPTGVPQKDQTPGTPASRSPTPGGTVQASPSATVPGGTSQKFKAGDVAVVVGTGDCLNVRVKAGLSNDAIICLADGEQVAITGGPEARDGLQWWKVRTGSGEGWAAEDYLARKP